MTSEVVLTKLFNFCSYILGILQIQKKPYLCLHFHKIEGKIALNLSKLSNSVVLNLIEVCWRIGSWLIRFLIEGYNTTSFYIFHCNLIMQSQKCAMNNVRQEEVKKSNDLEIPGFFLEQNKRYFLQAADLGLIEIVQLGAKELISRAMMSLIKWMCSYII